MPAYYTRFSDFKVGEEVDNFAVGTCKIIETKFINHQTPSIMLSNGKRCGYNCRGWITVEYLGIHLDGRPDKLYQRCDPIIGISEVDEKDRKDYQQWDKKEKNYYTGGLVFDCQFREVGDSGAAWPKPVDKIYLLDKVREGDRCRYCRAMCVIRKMEVPLAKTCDPRNGDPMCWDCYDDLQED